MQGGSCILIWGHFGSMCHLFQTTKNTDINIEEEEEDSQSYSCVQATSSHSWGVTKNHNGKFFEHHHINITSLWHPPIAAILQLWQWRPQGLPTGHQSDPKDGIVHHGVGVLQPVRYPDLVNFFFRELIAEWTAVKNITHYNEGFSSKHLTESRRVRDILCRSLGF